jgi:hypothetical protein
LICEERNKKGGKETYLTYKMENDDPWSLWNTVLKMAKKRALIDATLSATRSSGLFTQDVEDLKDWVEGDIAPPGSGTGQQSAYGGRRQSSQQTGQDSKCSEADCGVVISQAVLSYSMKHFNRPLCQKCQKKVKDAQAQQETGQPGDAEYQAPGTFSNEGQGTFGGDTF